MKIENAGKGAPPSLCAAAGEREVVEESEEALEEQEYQGQADEEGRIRMRIGCAAMGMRARARAEGVCRTRPPGCGRKEMREHAFREAKVVRHRRP